MIFYLYDSTNAITRQEGEKSSNRKNNKRSLSEFETVSVSARKGLFFCKNFCSLLDNRIWVTRKNPDFILLIPRFRDNAAAFTTLLAELCSMMLCIRCSRGLVTVSADRRTVGSVLCGCVGIVLVCTGVKALALPNLICILAAVLGSVAAYAAILLGMKNPLVLEYLEKAKQKFRKIS